MKGKAFAKVNLGLWITGRRSDGYHNLVTVFHLVDIADEIEVEPSDFPEVICENGPQGEDNIAHRALVLLSKQVDFNIGLKVHIKKNIPIGAGLGGGSSDCAFVLRAVLDYYPDIDRREVVSVAEKLGADVPFFLNDIAAALGTGKGENLKKIPTRLNDEVLIYYPGFSISTRYAYSCLKKEDFTPEEKALEKASKVIELIRKGDLKRGYELLENAFERRLREEIEVLNEAYESLKQLRADKLFLSGSGSAILAFFKNGVPEELPQLPGNFIKTRFLSDIDYELRKIRQENENSGI